MDTTTAKKTYQPQRSRMPQGSAQDPSIVPAGPASSSCDGQTATTSIETPKILEGIGIGSSSTVRSTETYNRKAATEFATEYVDTIIRNVENNPPSEDILHVENNPTPESILKSTEEKDIDSASMTGSIAMEWDEMRLTTKRKISRSAERGSSGENSEEDEILKRAKITRNRQRILGDEGTSSSSPCKEQSRSNPDLSYRPSEEDPQIMMLKKGYISKQKKLEIEEVKEEIATKKREDIRRKKEEKRKAEEELKKREQKEKMEAKILAQITAKSAEETDYICNMTASDLAAMALEYLDHVETIRTKCGTMQGALSGELKRRKSSLDNMVKALQAKAEDNGDPKFLRAKIDELLKKNREEEERRKREVNELKNTVTNLTKENRDMKKELKLIREDMEREKRERLEREKRREKEEKTKKYTPEKYLPEKEEDILTDPTMPLQETVRRCPSLMSIDDGPVLRPPLKGRATPIPNSNLKQIKTRIISNTNTQRKEGIKVISNIQIRPPKEKEVSKEVSKEVQKEAVEDMEWEENGLDWNQEIEDEEKTKGNKNISMEQGRETQKDKKQEEETWAMVTRKGRKEDRNKKKEKSEKTTSVNKQKPKKEEIKRKPPKTAAVSIKGDVTKGFSYAEALRKARTHIRMEELQIEAPRIRKGLNGATIIEISGPECNNKARKLADKLKEVLHEEKAAVTTPMVKGELRLTGLDESISKEEIAWAIEEQGACEKEEIRVGEIKRSRRGMGMVWIRCPLKAAIDIAKKKKIKVGWTIVGVVLLSARPLQCYRCWHQGHVKDTCRSQIDRSRNCFQCGKEGHNAAMCNNPVNCAICENLGYDSKHRVGSIKCEGVKARPQANAETARRTDTTTRT